MLNHHYQKHVINQKEFRDIIKEYYQQQAQNLISSKGNNVLTKIRVNGDKLFYRISKNEFAVIDSSGKIKIYFKPTGGIDLELLDYWIM